ncbi:MAG: hypothetical protein WCH34_04730 [Bacteroidota bacterium]
MLTLNTILKEMKEVPIDRLEELYQFVRSLSSKNKETNNLREKILSFSGAFSDMSSLDYSELVNHTKEVRANLFDRNIEI